MRSLFKFFTLPFLMLLLGLGQFGRAQDGSLIRFDEERVSARETDGTLQLGLRTTRPLSQDLRLGISIEGLDGANDSQIRPLQSEFTLSAGQTSQTLDLIIFDDANLTGEQEFLLQLFPADLDAHPGIITSSKALIRLIDDESFTPARLSDAQFIEGSGQGEVILTLDRPAEVAASATIGLYSDTAEGDLDFALESDVIFIAPGAQQARLPITILDDDLYESDERLFARVISSDALEIKDYEAQILILNDDPSPSLTFAAVEANEGRGQGFLTASLSQAAGVQTSVKYEFISGTAQAGVDFAALTGTLSFPAGAVQQLVPYEVVDDSRDEPNEEFKLVFSDPDGLQIPDHGLSITLIDNDSQPQLLANGPDLREGEEQSINFRLSAPSDRDISFGVRLVSDTARVPDDIDPLELRVHIPAGQVTAPAPILVPKIDEVYESAESLLVEFYDPENVGLPADSLQLNLLDEKRLPVLTLSDVVAQEGRRANAITFELSHPSSSTSTFTLRTQSGQARAGEDFTNISDVFSFPAGSTTLTIPLNIIDNSLNEGDEQFRVLISAPDGLSVIENSFPLIISDDDPLPQITLAGSNTIEEGSLQGLVIELTLSEPSGLPITITADLLSENGSVRRDFESFNRTLTIPPAPAEPA